MSAQKKIGSGFPAKSEPHQILDGIDLSGKTAIVTGGYSGIGFETVKALVNASVHVHAPARDVDRARKELDGIIDADHINAMDLSDVDSVRGFVENFASCHDSIDILIGNAGVMACPEQRTKQGWEWQIGVNHFGHFALVTGLMPQLQAAQNGARVVLLSSIGHIRSPIRFDDMHFEKEPYEKWTAYGQSKTAQALMAVELDRRMADKGVRGFAVHPGGIFTPLQRHLTDDEMIALGWKGEDGNVSERAAAAFKTPAQGCTTSLWAATNPMLDGMGGVYCEDCDIADSAPADSTDFFGVRPWAVSPDDAKRLWEVTESALA